MILSKTLKLSCDLIHRKSVTPEDAGCQDVMIERLERIGFTTEKMPFADVKNFWSRRGHEEPLFIFAGHTDVVPSGPLQKWNSDPFAAQIRDGLLYGRGAADMKGSLAAMLTATERFVEKNPQHKGSIAYLITSDEEGPWVNGTTKVVDVLQQRNIKPKWCLVGEPSSTEQLGDVIKNGRRGSLSASVTVHGKQGHVAYPHLASNPIHLIAPVLHKLATKNWDDGNEFFPPTSLQIVEIHGGENASNIIPGHVEFQFNFRYSTEHTDTELKAKVEQILQQHQLNFDIKWTLNGPPFLTKSGDLIDATKSSIQEICHITARLSTAGGTSDGRFIARTGAEVIELGPCNHTIHKVNECTSIADLDLLSAVYERILEKLLL